MADRQLRNLQEIIGYSFTDGSLLAAALTHRSAGTRNNERLEFLGDGILTFVVAEELYRRFDGAAHPAAGPGDSHAGWTLPGWHNHLRVDRRFPQGAIFRSGRSAPVPDPGLVPGRTVFR